MRLLHVALLSALLGGCSVRAAAGVLADPAPVSPSPTPTSSPARRTPPAPPPSSTPTAAPRPGSATPAAAGIRANDVLLTEVAAAAPPLTVVLNGSDQAISTTLPIVVTDQRPGGTGWRLTITSTL